MNRKRVAAVAGALVVVVALAVALFRPQYESASARATRLEEHIECPVCTGEDVAHSNSSESIAIRQNIEDRIRQGQSDSQILGYYARLYPNKILNPSDSGLGLLVWGLPVAAVIAAVAGLGFAIARVEARAALGSHRRRRGARRVGPAAAVVMIEAWTPWRS